MKRRKRIYYTDSQKALMWDRWQRGESLHRIAARGTVIARPDDQRVFEHAALFEILNERRGADRHPVGQRAVVPAVDDVGGAHAGDGRAHPRAVRGAGQLGQ